MANPFALPRAEWKTIGLIAVGYGLSRIYMLVLPPLFPLMRDDLGVSYTDLGVMVAVFSGASWLCQFPAGVLVDRIGARPVLFAGLVMQAASFALAGLFPNYWVMMALVTIAGIGNSVFLPADYAILAARVGTERLGRTFGIHTSAGYVGLLVAPFLIVTTTSAIDWMATVSAMGMIGLLFVAFAAFHRDALSDVSVAAARGERRAVRHRPSTFRLLISPPVLLFLLAVNFLDISDISDLGARQAFDDIANLLQSVLAGAGLVFWISAAILVPFAGGALADRIEDRERLVAICLVPYAILLGIAALDILPVDFAVWLGLGAFLVSLARPAIDLLVLGICPPGRIGTVFGFVAFGGSVGGELVAWGSRALTVPGIPEMAVWLPVPAVLLCVVSIYAARATSR